MRPHSPRSQAVGSWSVVRGLFLIGIGLSLLLGTPALHAGASQAMPTITVSGAGTFDFDNTPHVATAVVTGSVGENLGSATISYIDLSTNVESSTPPVKPGSYRIDA